MGLVAYSLTPAAVLQDSDTYRPKKRNCLFPVMVQKNRVGRSVNIYFFLHIFLVKNVCFMHVLR